MSHTRWRRATGQFSTIVVPPPPPPPPPPSIFAPVNSSLPVITASAIKGQTLGATTGAWLNSPTAFAYDWKRGGVSIGATASTYVLVAADVGAVITCAVTASNAAGSATATSAGTTTVIDLAPVNSALPAITGTPTEGQTLSVSNGTWINTPISYARQWLRNGSAIGGATAATYLLVTADVGGNISCTVTATNSGGSAPATSASVGPVGGATATPHNTVLPVLSGAAVVGQTLFTSDGSWDITPTSFTYQWYDASGAISGETADTYLIVDADVGKQIHCAVTAYNIAAASSPASSTATSAVTDIDLTTIPAITSVTRTSASTVIPMTVDTAFASNVFEGYFYDRIVYTDSGLSIYKGGSEADATASHLLTNADLQPGATIDWSGDGGQTIAATDWVQYRVHTTTPNGLYKSYTYGTAISPTDAVVAMTWSVSDNNLGGGGGLTNGNLTASQGGSLGSARGSHAVGFNLTYWELTVVSGAASVNPAVANATASLSTRWGGAPGDGSATPDAAEWQPNNNFIFYNGGFVAGDSIANGNVLGVAVDRVNKLVWFAKNNVWQNSGNPATGANGLAMASIGSSIYPAIQLSSTSSVTANFGTTPGGTAGFTYTPPAGFVAP